MVIGEARELFGEAEAEALRSHLPEILREFGDPPDCYVEGLRAAKRSPTKIDNLHAYALKPARRFLRDGIPAAPIQVLPAAAPADESRKAYESAKAASRKCPRCGGAGLATAYHRAGGDASRRLPPTVPAYCECRLGRHLIEHDSARRYPDMEDVKAGRGDWLADPPGVCLEVRSR